MKISVCALTIFFALPCFAQTVGIEGGINLSSYQAVSNRETNPGTSRSNISTTQKRGLVLGGHADFKLKESIYLRTGLLMVLKGGKEKGISTGPGYTGPYSQDMKFVAFDFPINLVYKTASAGKSRLLFGAGLVPGLLIETGLSRTDVGASVLAGYEMPKGLHANLMYNYGLANVATQFSDYKTLRNRSLMFTVGYYFRHKTKAEVEKVKAFEQQPVNVQSPEKALFAELGSPAGFLTLNYDTRLSKSNKGLGLRIGAGTLFDPYDIGFTVPVTVNYLFGERTHFFEVAAGASFYSIKESNQDGWFNFENENFVVPFVWAGYRYQPLYKKFFFRAGVGQPIGIRMPVVSRVPSLSFGYSLR